MLPPPRQPTSAGVCSYFSGGADHYQPDREHAAQIAPGDLGDVFRRMARNNRRYLACAVRHMALKGISQFLDLGCGFPITGGDRDERRATHEVARGENPDARVVYVDNDPEPVEYVEGVLAAATPGIGAVCADMASVREVLASDAVRALIKRQEPVGLIFGLSLHYMPPGRGQVTVATYVSALKPGSMVAITVPRYETGLFAKVRDACTIAELRNLSDHQVRALFSGVDILNPGIGPVAHLRPEWGTNGGTPATAHVVGGVGLKPRL